MSVTLSHEDAYYNAKLLEKKQALKEEEVYLFGSMGSRMVLVLRESSLFSRIWHLLLKIFGFLDTTAQGVERLLDATTMHRQGADYKKWVVDKGKITPLERKKLMDQHASNTHLIEKKSNDLRLRSAAEQALSEKMEANRAKITSLQENVRSLEAKIGELELQIAEKNAIEESKNKYKEKAAEKQKALKEKAQAVLELERRLAEARDESALYQKGFKLAKGNEDVRHYIERKEREENASSSESDKKERRKSGKFLRSISTRFEKHDKAKK